ncbi:MAG: RluA family pseudouridine synthase [Myxococcota bacterium]|nr:RluA family pseudouridine synthase [Myxococcota bacterium]MDW8363336.1 RluA family pseudouridine synthase [Myxococcales bacterium]
MSGLPRERLVVPPERQGERLDRFLASGPHGWSRAAVQRWIEQGRVRIGDAPARASSRLRAGDVVVVEPTAPVAYDAMPETLPLHVVHEDEQLAVIDKPAGLVVHPAPGHASGTLVNALLGRYGALPPTGSSGLPRPGIVHRLDRDTSGLLVVARTASAHEKLARQFAAHRVERAYLAIVVGVPPDRVTYDTLHGRHPTDRKRFSTRVSRGRRAVTHVEVLERFEGAALVRCTLETGRTHQIRVHAAEAGTPVLADALYGRTPRSERVRRAAAAIGRQALHAALLGFEHPATGRRVRWESPLPADFERALEVLRGRDRT